MSFDVQKQATLTRMTSNDKSRAGEVDAQIKGLINLINSHPDFYTTSSCAGRILIYEKEECSKKNQTKWLLASHDPITQEQINNALKDIKNDVWLAAQPVILHIATRTQESAKKLLHLCQQAGLKRGGAVTFLPRIVLEMEGVDELCTIVAKKGNLIITPNYLQVLLNESNIKLARNAQRIAQVVESFQATFK